MPGREHFDIASAMNAVDRCSGDLARLALGEVQNPDEQWHICRLAIRLVRNSDHSSYVRLHALFQSLSHAGLPGFASRLDAFLANRALGLADYSGALSLASSGHERARTETREAEAALCATIAGSSAQAMGRFPEAIRWFDEALVASRRCGDVAQEAGALSSRAIILMRQGHSAPSLDLMQQAIDLYRALDEDAKVARCLLNRGVLLSKLGRLDAAESDLQFAFETFQRHNLPNFEWSARLALARVFHLSGRNDASQEMLAIVLKRTSAGEDPRTRVIALEYLTDYQLETGHTDDANVTSIAALTEAAAIGESTDLFLEANHRRALVLAAIPGLQRDALLLAERAVLLAEQQGDAFELGAALHALGACLSAMTDSKGAADALSRSMEVAERIGDRYVQTRSAFRLARLRAETGHLIDAVGLLTEARRGFEYLKSSRGLAECDRALLELISQMTHERMSSEEMRSEPRQREMTSHIVIENETSRFVSSDARLRQLLITTLKLSPRSLSMLILGETGTGKELVAEAIHRASGRKGPFVPINCGALPGDLLEAELFGHARGAYTGAVGERGGLIEHSHRGTLFLDEIGDMPLKAQARLLRALERGEIRRLGENSPRLVDLRIVAATHRNLLEMVSAGEFRLDLYHRLTGFVVTIPPLRERIEDIEVLVGYFLQNYSSEQDKAVRMSDDVRNKLLRHSWPGNVRQLRNTIHRLVSLAEPGQVITRLPFELEGGESPRSLPEALEAEERRRVLAALEASHWNKAKAAASLGASRTTLIAKMKRLGIEPPDSGARVR